MPKITDPGEMDIIRDTYFEGQPQKMSEEQQTEAWERAEAKRNNNNQNR